MSRAEQGATQWLPRAAVLFDEVGRRMVSTTLTRDSVAPEIDGQQRGGGMVGVDTALLEQLVNGPARRVHRVLFSALAS